MATSIAASAEQVRTAVDKYYASINALDAGAFVASFADDGVSHDPEGAPPHDGPSGLRAFFEGIGGLCQSVDIRAERVDVAGSGAGVPWSITATGKNGATATASGVDVFTVNSEGRISELHAYWDPTEFITALSS